MRISFYLDKPNSPQSVVLINVAFRGQRLRFGSGFSIAPEHWNIAKQQPRATDPLRNAHLKQMNVLRNEVETLYNQMQFSDKNKAVSKQSIEEFKTRIKEFLKPDHGRESTSGFLSDFAEFINTYTLHTKSGMITSQRPGKRSLQNYNLVRDSISEFLGSKSASFTYDDVDASFYTRYCAWLANERNIVDASISNYIKVLKTFMKWARNKQYHNNSAYEQFYRDRRHSRSMALTLNELRTIRDLELSDEKKLERVRDHFMLQVYTGMRYGDMERLSPKNFDEEAGLIRYTTAKTNATCIVPITAPLRELLEKFPSRVFEFASNVKQNLYLKEIGKRAGFDKPVVVSQYVLGERQEKTRQRSELLSTHVARRTFVTMSIQFGVPESAIQAVTGHAARGMLQQHYVNLDEEAVRSLICKAWDQL